MDNNRRYWNRSKYNSKITVVDGIKFHSKLESRYYSQLKLLQAAGEVQFFLRQVPLHLPGGTKYVVDFMVLYPKGIIEFVDVKGRDTPLSKTKRSIVEAVYPIMIKIVTKV